MSGFRLVDLAKPFLPLLPEVELPIGSLPFDDKVMYTIGASFVYLLAQLPVYGGAKVTGDPISFLRPAFGAERGTLLEFGVFPIISSGIIFQLLAGLKLIKVNLANRTDRQLFQSLQKLFAIFQYVVLTNIFVATGYYGYNLSFWQVILINFQLITTGFIMTLTTEVIDKGYGFGSGCLTFVTVNASSNFVGDILGINAVKTTRGSETQGAVINLIGQIRNAPFKNAILNAFTRPYLPNLIQGYVTLATLAVAIYLQNFRIELPIRSNRVRAVNNIYPIRLLYTGAMPLLFSYVVLFYLNIIGYTIVNLGLKNDSSNPLVKVLGAYTSTAFGGSFVVEKPSIIYFFSPPASLTQAITSPLKTIGFALIVIVSSAFFANTWSLISGSAPRDIAQQFKEQGISLAGRRDISISKELNRVIPVAAVSGATVLAVVSLIGDFFGGKGKSAGVLIACGAAFSFLEIIATEYQQSGGSQNFSQLFGGLGQQ
ncbi:CYFA0S07e04852g1_1 [Cyberlindnera fabianii]|uniref:CYFA0S07e04852g1_1 n=1 Tax=Cyberlindnera fabianii TaxID=36022 RepID=A0A061AWS9_CYBFA|nr:CYFA0S07e04852g1_1 [Cyberlindnera fabianii]